MDFYLAMHPRELQKHVITKTKASSISTVNSLIYRQRPKVIPQLQKSHRPQCIFPFARKFTTLQLANIVSSFDVI